MAAQEQATKANAMKVKIEKTQVESKCRLRGKVDETVRQCVNALCWHKGSIKGGMTG